MTSFATETDARPTVILVLDDSGADREVLRRFLSSDSRRDYVFHERSGIEYALDACLEVQPDCVLLDYSLGDGTGLDFLKMLPQIGGTRTFPVVMLTGSGSEEVAAEAFKAGAQDYLVKGTLTPDVLQRAVGTAMYKARTERLLESQRAELERLFLEAREANSRKDQFLAALSHELRTPLTPILTAVSSVQPREASREELEDLFATIRRNVELEARLIDDLLDLTRISKGKLRLDLRPVDTHEALHHALETCLGEIAAKRLKLSLHLEAGARTVQADSARLQQVFWNLVKNAVKFTPPDGEITIRTSNPKPAVLELQVRDTGCGIPPDALTKIFDAFEQGSSQVTVRFGGLGLGLAISRALIDAHNGELHAESDGIGKGATFRVNLPVDPRATADPIGRDRDQTNGRQASKDPFPFSHCLILLVEDHPDSARILSATMRRRGFRVVVAGSVAEAIAAFKKEDIHAIVSDIGLPDGDGLELMASLTKIRKVPGIALSGYGMEHDLARSHAVGFVEHLTKPVDWPQLESALLRLLREHKCEHHTPAENSG
ncbi:MAG: response regulator [Chthoniobacteraceae bacterium]